MAAPIKIQVPATSANLGPGFDVLGLAVQFYNRFTARPANELSVELLPGTCIDTNDLDLSPDQNLLAKSYRYYFEVKQIPFQPAILGIEGHIPLSRGLGSSSSAIVGGLALASVVHQNTIDKYDLLKMATVIEGHPDNVTPAMLGGVQYCIDEITNKELDWPIDWELVFVIPPTPLNTEQARSVLPKKYSERQLEVAKKALLAWLIAVQTYDMPKMQKALASDVLHEPYRKRLIPEYTIASQVAQRAKAMGCVISGAGSSLLVITHNLYLQDTLAQLKAEDKLSHCQITSFKLDTEGLKRLA